MTDYTIEYVTGNVELNRNNLLVEDITNMHEIEYWEDRLENVLDQPFVVAFREIGGKIRYSIFTELRKKESVFK